MCSVALEITSKDNPKYKQLHKLLTSKKERTKTGLFATEGLRLTADLLRSHVPIMSLFYTARFQQRNEQLVLDLEKNAEQSFLISDDLAARISDAETAQGVFAICKKLDNPLAIDRIYSGGRYVFLVSLQDPGNVGTIIRTAEAFGVDGVILSADCPDLYSPKVLRSTMGSALRIPVMICEDSLVLLATLKEHHVSTYAAVLDEESLLLGSFTFPKSSVVLIGNEGNGLPDSVVAECSSKLMIPMKGNAESLNAAAAANVILWEMSK